jgi:hypothetical protein
MHYGGPDGRRPLHVTPGRDILIPPLDYVASFSPRGLFFLRLASATLRDVRKARSSSHLRPIGG